jgi:ATP-dependent DNA helicase PIF1
MASSFSIRKKWIEDFKRCNLVDLPSKTYKHQIARQLFYGKTQDDYPANDPHDFKGFYNSIYTVDRADGIDETLRFLNFIGIKLSKDALNEHLRNFPNDYHLFVKKVFFLLRTLAHQNKDFDYGNPFKLNLNDVSYLLDIETGKRQLSIFGSYELPQLYNRGGSIPAGYADDERIAKLFHDIEHSNQSFFLTGKAGTGKSTFIHYFTQETKKNVLRLAFTGIAAMNVGGVTIHSFFRFPLKPLTPGDDDIKIFEENDQKRKIITDTDTFVIDEVSMLRSDLLEAIDHSLRNNGGNPQLPFGGKQMLFVGDIFQLPPVHTQTDTEHYLFTEHFRSHYFFDSMAYQRLDPAYIELTKSHRQRDDSAFLDLLDQIRTCQIKPHALGSLNERFDPDYIPRTDQFEITLTTINDIAARENSRRLHLLPGHKYVFVAQTKGDISEDRLPDNARLELKQHAQVMFIRNDPERRWVNGTLGKVDFITDDLIEVKLADGNVYEVQKETWEHRGYKYDKAKRKVISEVKGTFTQYPLRLAWAITIHKSQGLTFDKVVIDLGSGTFVNGQLYTALSRCRRLDGIVLKKKVRMDDIIVDDRLAAFYNTLTTGISRNTVN